MRLLFVASTQSIQTVHWLKLLANTGWDIHLFDPLHGLISTEHANVTIHTGWRKKEMPKNAKVNVRWPFLRGQFRLQKYFPQIWNYIVPESEKMLAQLITKLQPDCLHCLGMQNSLYTLENVKKILGSDLPCPVIYSSKGSDMFYWARFPEHQRQIVAALQNCQYLMCNCERDVLLAKKHGFTGTFLGYFQGMGGYPVNEMQTLRQHGHVSSRTVIAVKGLQHAVGRAYHALAAMEQCAGLLGAYEIYVYQAHPWVKERIVEIRERTGLNIESFGGFPRDMWQLFGKSRLAIGVSESDGIPNAMIEAMIMGAFPIQTDPGGATSELIDNGINGFTIPHDDVDVIADKISHALTNDELVDGAAVTNFQRASERFDESIVRLHVIEAYEVVLEKRELVAEGPFPVT